jgi:hypothetical protein
MSLAEYSDSRNLIDPSKKVANIQGEKHDRSLSGKNVRTKWDFKGKPTWAFPFHHNIAMIMEGVPMRFQLYSRKVYDADAQENRISSNTA